jgi:Mce-associated membrane protein
VQVPVPSARLVGVLLGVVLIAGLAAVAIISSVRLHHQNVLNHARRSAVAAATAYTTEFASYNYSDLQSNFAKTEAHSVDPFRTQYRTITAQIQADVVKVKAMSSAKILSAGVVSVTPSRAVVDVIFNQTITNAVAPPRVDHERGQMTLVRKNGHWLISAFSLP